MTMRGDNTPELCQELIDHILDHLHSDIPALKVCSLVSHSFHRSSQYHMFRSLQLRMGSKSPRSFVAFIRDRSQFCCLIKSLSLTFVMGQPLDLRDLRQILSSLSTLDTLQLKWENILFGDIEPLPSSQLLKLVSLALIEFGPSPHPSFDMLAILSSFASIDSLCIDYPLVSGGRDTDDSEHRLPDWITACDSLPFLRVRSLVLRMANGATNSPFPLFARCLDLRSLAIRCSHDSVVHSSGSFLQQVGSGLIHLEVDASAYHGQSQGSIRESVT